MTEIENITIHNNGLGFIAEPGNGTRYTVSITVVDIRVDSATTYLIACYNRAFVYTGSLSHLLRESNSDYLLGKLHLGQGDIALFNLLRDLYESGKFAAID